MEEEILPSTSSEDKSDIKSFQRPCTVLEKDYVAERIKSSESSRFARLLGLEESDIDEVEWDCQRKNTGIRETVYQLIVKWEQIKGSGATVEELIAALLKMGKTDIVQHLFPEYYHGKEQPLCDLLKQIQRKQEKKFSNLMLPRTLWMTKKLLPLEELYVELVMKKKDKFGEEKDIKVPREELFEKVIDERDKNQTNELPHRILVEGHPGYGKTTLVTKLLFDWSKGKKYMRDKFDLVFVIPLRNFKGNLWNHVLKQIKGINGREEKKLREIEAIEGRVLLLLDGLDECNERVKESLVPLFNGDQHPNMTVLVTCRTGFIRFEHQPDDDFATMGTAGFGHHLFWDKRIQIKGISQERRFEFIQKYLNVEPSSLTYEFSGFDLEKNNLYECPLFLLLFAIFAQEGILISVTTKTELYKRIVNFVLSRNLNRENLLKEEIDVFDQDIQDHFTWRNLLINFGRLCLKKMKEESLIFEERELLECSGGDEIILKLGFVSKGLSFIDNEEEEHYEPIHRTFVEFLAAFYLSSLQGADFEKEVNELTLECNIWPRRNQLIYSFLGGFLQENAYKLFNVLSSYTCLISLTESGKVLGEVIYSLNEILKEIPANDVIFKSLIPFLSPDLKKLEFFLEPMVKIFLLGLLNYLYRLKIPNNVILGIIENVDILGIFPGIFHANMVEFNIDHPELEMRLLKSKIICENLVIMSTGQKRSEISVILEEVLSKIEANRIFFLFQISSTNFCNFYEVITGENLKNFKIYYLLLYINCPRVFNITHQLIENLIGRRKIEFGLHVGFDVKTWDIDKINRLVDFVCKSHLTSFSLQYSGTHPITFTAHEKQWKYLRLKGNFKDVAIEDGHSLSVEHLEIGNLGFYRNKWNWLKKCVGLRRLQCDSQLIIELSSSDFADWNGFEAIEYLEIAKAASKRTLVFYDALQSVISRCKNLQEIKTPLYGHEEYLFKLISLAPSLTKIYVYGTELDEFLSALKLIGSELTMNEQNVKIDLNLDELRIISLRSKVKIQEVEFFEVLEQCCLKNISFIFSYSISTSYRDIGLSKMSFLMMKEPMCKYFLSRERFKVYSAWEADQYSLFGIPKLRKKIGIRYEFPG